MDSGQQQGKNRGKKKGGQGQHQQQQQQQQGHGGGNSGGQGQARGGGKKGQGQHGQQQQAHSSNVGQSQQQQQQQNPGQGKGKYQQKKQQQQPQHQQPTHQPEATAGGNQQYEQFLQKMQQSQQQPAAAQTEPPKQPQAQPQQQPQQQQQKAQGGGGKYKQKQQQKQSEQQQQQQQMPQQPPSHGRSPTSPDTTTPSTGSSSPSHGAIERVEEDLASMKIEKPQGNTSLRQVLLRAGAHGKRGKAIRLEVNYIPLLLEKLVGTAYHYDVDIQPMASRKWQRAAFARFVAEALAGQSIAFDGNKNAYTARKLNLNHYKKEVVAREDNRDRKFTVTMKEASIVDLQCLKSYMQAGNENLVKPMKAIQCLDVVLRTAYELNPRFVKFRKSIYAVPTHPEPIGANHELWYGLFQSALLGSKPFLNIDVSHKAFPCGGPVLNVVSDLCRGRVPDRLSEWEAGDVHNFLKGMEISYKGPDAVAKIFKYNSLKGPASEQKFKLEDGTQMTVAAYFQSKGVRLQYPALPVMHVGSTIRNIMLPMELCSIPPGQALIKKHPDICTQQIIRKSATDTGTRKRKIMDLFNQIGYNNSATIKDFGVTVGNAFEVVDGRIIEPPNVQYSNNKVITPFKGQWRADGTSFIQVNQNVLRWRILNLDMRTRPDSIQRFGGNIFAASRKQGIQLEPFSMQTTYHEPRDMRNAVRQLDSIFGDLKKQNMDFVIVVISAMGDHYSKVKQRAELETGLLTQCVKGDTLFRKGDDMSTINNIWLKINAKTNGTNHIIKAECKPPLIRRRVMFIGADVTHPSPEQTSIPSVVGVAASYDLEGFRYSCCYRLQNPKDEMIRDLENIVKKQLTQYKVTNGQLPELIMYYRDGVSEGQFSEILTIELNAIQSAIASVNPGNARIGVTFIVVQKRHHARFFPSQNCPTEGRNNNLPPGTIVDKHITAPNQYQFFLISHQAVQGVAKPTKYCVLYDDANSDPDQLHAVTYALCHMFARCNRAVSYPAPTYYAHLAAFRGRVYIKDRRLDMNNLLGEYRKLQIKSEIIDGHPMFFV